MVLSEGSFLTAMAGDLLLHPGSDKTADTVGGLKAPPMSVQQFEIICGAPVFGLRDKKV